MLGPKRYRQLIEEIGIDGMEIDTSSIETAMETLNHLDEMEKILKKIRYNIRTDIRKIRLDYMDQLQMLDDSSQKKGLFGRKKSAAKVIEEKKELKKKRNVKISSYELVENMIDNYMTQIEDSRVYIRESIEKRVG